MNPGAVALERLVEMGLFAKGAPVAGKPVQYWAFRCPTAATWANAVGLVHVASSWVGARGLSVTRGRQADDVIYHYDAKQDRQ